MSLAPRRYRSARHAGDDDPAAALRRHLREHLSGHDLDEAERLLDALGASAEDALGLGRSRMPQDSEVLNERGEYVGPPGERGAEDALAMDAAPASAAGQRALRVAAARCASILGADAALSYDSAEDVLRSALAALGVPSARTVHYSALVPLLTTVTRQQTLATDDGVHGGVPRPSPTRIESAGASYLPASTIAALARIRSLG